MSYRVLARKWRPQIFSDVVGQEHIITALSNSLVLDKIHHAYLLSGTRGVGKTTIARLLAKGLNCENGITATPCGKCKNCYDVENGCFVDLIEIDAASRTKVEDTRELLDNVQYAPINGRFKVYLIDEVHMLSRYSFNALLKILEEPPIHVKFLLATTDLHKIPETVLSRCLQFHLKLLGIDNIYNKLEYILKEEEISIDPCALKRLARAANGSMRDALSLTEQAIAIGQNIINLDTVNMMFDIVNIEYPFTLLEALINADGSFILNQIEQYSLHSTNWEGLLVEMLSLLHSIAIDQVIEYNFYYDQNEYIQRRLHKLTQCISEENLQLYYKTFLIGRKDLPYAPNFRIGVEMTFLRALSFSPLRIL